MNLKISKNIEIFKIHQVISFQHPERALMAHQNSYVIRSFEKIIRILEQPFWVFQKTLDFVHFRYELIFPKTLDLAHFRYELKNFSKPLISPIFDPNLIISKPLI